MTADLSQSMFRSSTFGPFSVLEAALKGAQALLMAPAAPAFNCNDLVISATVAMKSFARDS
jgi:hypothetical protein